MKAKDLFVRRFHMGTYKIYKLQEIHKHPSSPRQCFLKYVNQNHLKSLLKMQSQTLPRDFDLPCLESRPSNLHFLQLQVILMQVAHAAPSYLEKQRA